MKRANALHEKAMEAADAADLARRQGNPDLASTFLLSAATFEEEAASLVKDEPSRSILYRSAASLFLECGEHRKAEQLVSAALAGEPPDEIADELRDLLEQVHFERHLDVRGIELAHDEFQMSIAGEAVGFGVAPSEKFIRRIEDTQRLIYRTAERTAHQPFREVSGPVKAVKRELEVYVTVPRAASLAITFRLSRPRDQELLISEVVQPKEVVSEMLTCLGLLNEGQDEQLRDRIGSDPYFRNFVAVAKQIAPDGKNIKTVGFTGPAAAGGTALQVAFRRPAKSIQSPRSEKSGAEVVTFEGRLLMADERKPQTGKISIVDSRRHADHLVTVPAGMMADVVRPLWGYEVVATCSVRDRKATLIDIQRAGDDGPDEKRRRKRRAQPA